MKTKIFLIAIFAFLLLTALQCKKEKPTLPPETQEGKGTFGCLIDGEVFVDGWSPYLGHPAIQVLHLKYINTLEIDAYLRPYGKMKIRIFNPTINTPTPITFGEYYSLGNNNNTGCISFGGREIGEIVLTRFDTMPITIGSHVVSGRFKFDGQCLDLSMQPAGDLIKQITEGRFDLKFNFYNE